MKGYIIGLLLLLVGTVFLAGCAQPPAQGDGGTDLDFFTSQQADLGTGNSAADVTADELEDIENDLDELGDMDTSLNTEIGDSGVDDSTFG